MADANFLSLKEYIEQTYTELKKLEDANLSDEDRTEAAYTAYANMVDLGDEVKCILRDFRRKLKIKDADVKKWMKEQESDEPEESVEDEKKD